MMLLNVLTATMAVATLLVVASGAPDKKKKFNMVSNFATGGALTTDENLTGKFDIVFPPAAQAQGLVVPGLQQQVSWAQETLEGDIKSNLDLVVVWAGVNDMLLGVFFQGIPLDGDWSAVTSNAATNIINAMQAMADLGGKYFVVPNLPSLGSLPILIDAVGGDPVVLEGLTGLTLSYNALLSQRLDDFEASNPDALVARVDIFLATLDGLETGGFADTTGFCYDSATAGMNPPPADECDFVRNEEDQIISLNYAFVDSVNPTEGLYRYWAEAAAAAVQALPGGKRRFRRVVVLGDNFSDGGAIDDLWLRSMGFDLLPDITYKYNRFSSGLGFIDILEDSLRVKHSSQPYIQ